MKYKERDELVADLRELANVIEQYGHRLPLELPYFPLAITERFYEDDEGKPSPKEQLKKAARILPGKVEKDMEHSDYEIKWKAKNGRCEIVFETSKENVCVKKVVGVEKVQKWESKPVEGEFTEREIVEWECTDSLLK